MKTLKQWLKVADKTQLKEAEITALFSKMHAVTQVIQYEMMKRRGYDRARDLKCGFFEGYEYKVREK